MMIARYSYLSGYPNVFRSMTGLTIAEFDELVADVFPRWVEQHQERLQRAGRRKAIGGGHPFSLSPRDQVLLTVIWLRIYPTNEVLGYLLGVSDSTASRILHRVVPMLEQAGRD